MQCCLVPVQLTNNMSLRGTLLEFTKKDCSSYQDRLGFNSEKEEWKRVHQCGPDENGAGETLSTQKRTEGKAELPEEG